MKQTGRLVVLGALVALAGTLAEAQVPYRINYQGRLIDGTNLFNGTVGLDIRLFDAETAGTQLYGDSNAIQVVDGLYSTVLGDNTYLGDLKAAFAGAMVWVELVVDGVTLSPRERLGAVAFAMKADGVTTGAITSAMIANGAVGSLQLANNAVTSNKIAVGAVQSQHIAIGAIDSPQIANGAVNSAKLSSDSVGRVQLIKGYEAGRVNVEALATTNTYDFTMAQVSTTIAFDISFATAPIVTLGVTTTNRSFAAENGLAVTAKDTNAFTMHVEFPHETVSLGAYDTGDYDYTSIAEVNGRPAAVIADLASNHLFYVRAADPLGIRWNERVPVATNANRIYSYPSLAVIGGRPAICYKDTNGWLRYMRALDVNGTNWSAAIAVDVNPDTGDNSQLLEVDGHPAIAYKDDGHTTLMFAWSDTVAGTNSGDWNMITVDVSEDPGDYLSMAIIDGNPAIAYFESNSNDLWYVRAYNAQGSIWNAPQLIRSTGSSGVGVSLADVNGAPAVAYRYYESSTTNRMYFYRANDSVGSSWGVLVSIDDNPRQAVHSHLGVYGGYPTVIYFGEDEDDLILVRSTHTNGYYWNDSVLVATNGNAGRYPSVANIHGTPGVVYANFTEERYEYIRSGNPPTDSWVDWIAVEP